MKDSEAGVRASFISQAEACEALGSAFTGRLCRLIAARLEAQSAIGQHIFHWKGDYSAKADNVALRICGAINHLALMGADKLLQAVYPPRPNLNFMDDDTVWEIISGGLECQGAAIIDFMNQRPKPMKFAAQQRSFLFIMQLPSALTCRLNYMNWARALA
jgi:hypothetical protein